MAKDDGGPAFPTADVYSPQGQVMAPGDPGMSLRDYFAASAMQALTPGAYSGAKERTVKECESNLARVAYTIADAMLEARKQ